MARSVFQMLPNTDEAPDAGSSSGGRAAGLSRDTVRLLAVGRRGGKRHARGSLCAAIDRWRENETQVHNDDQYTRERETPQHTNE